MRHKATELISHREGRPSGLVAVQLADRHIEHLASSSRQLGELHDLHVRVVLEQHRLGRLAERVRLREVADHLIRDTEDDRSVNVEMAAVLRRQLLPKLVDVVEDERCRVVRIGRNLRRPGGIPIHGDRSDRGRDIRVIEHAVDLHPGHAVELELVLSTGEDLGGGILLTSGQIDLRLRKLGRLEARRT